MAKQTDTSPRQSVFLLIFALLWTALVLCFDGFLAHAFHQQIRAQGFPRTQARIIDSEVTENSDSDGTTYGARVRYEYTVDGVRHESDRVRHGAMSTSDGRWARQTVRENPPGSVRPAYYDPANPAESVLQVGVDGQSWFMLLFLSPFNAVMIFLWWLIASSRRPSPPAGGARIASDGDRVLVQLNPTSRAAAAIGAFGGVNFAGVFALAFTVGISGDSKWAQVVLGLAAAAAVWALLKPAGAIKPDLVIDPGRGRLELPAGHLNAAPGLDTWREWRKSGNPPLVIPLEHLRRVVMRERVKEDSDGKSTTHVAALCVQDPATNAITEHDLGRWMLPHRAESFARWLRETLGAPGESDDRPGEAPPPPGPRATLG